MLNNDTKGNKYPECEKWAKVQDKFMLIDEFLDFLFEKEVYLGRPANSRTEFLSMIPGGDHKKLLMSFFEIDEKKLEAEREAIFDSIDQDEGD